MDISDGLSPVIPRGDSRWLETRRQPRFISTSFLEIDYD